jgi:L-alanine-DL-glutamate epimerase-like enolase superfamily enzyme
MSTINKIDFYGLTPPKSPRIADSTHTVDAVKFIVVRVFTEDGEYGESYLLSLDYSPRSIQAALKDIAELAVGLDVSEISAFCRLADHETEYFGSIGLSRWAVAAIEIAMWDAWARTLVQPVWRILGGASKPIPLYGSGGWLCYSIDELLDEISRYIRRGFYGVKIKIGSCDPEIDIERICRVREALGPDRHLFIDANQGYSISTAIKVFNATRKQNITWFEEPFPNRDFSSYNRFRSSCDLPIAFGEREYDLMGLLQLARNNSLDVWMPDILRIGGVTRWLQSVYLADELGLQMCTVRSAWFAEYFDWIDSTIDHAMKIDNGCAIPHSEPGWGFRFLDEYLSELD